LTTIRERYDQQNTGKQSCENARQIQVRNYSVGLMNEIIELFINQLENQLPEKYQEIEVGDGEMIITWFLINFKNHAYHLMDDGRVVKYTPPIKKKVRTRDSQGNIIDGEEIIDEGYFTEIPINAVQEITQEVPGYDLVMELFGALSKGSMFENFGVYRDSKWDLTLDQVEAREAARRASPPQATIISSIMGGLRRFGNALRDF
jgi:hypothetical protein